MALDVNMVIREFEKPMSPNRVRCLCSILIGRVPPHCSVPCVSYGLQGVMISGVPFVSSRNAPVLKAIPHH
jgi:hypothetical protein